MNSSGDEEQLGVAASFSLSPMDSSTDASSSSAVSDTSSPLPSLSCRQQQGQLASMDACRQFYERRLQSLERFRCRVASYQQHPDLESSKQQQALQQQQSAQYHQLQADMMELMENDVNLMRQLMALGERIEELKTLALFAASSSSTSPNGISPTCSMISLDGVCCEERIERDENGNDESVIEAYEFSASKSSPLPRTASKMDNGHDEEPESGVDGDESELREEPHCVTVNGAAPRVYFSRQNSVLRIPIPPSRGLRSKTVADLQQHAVTGGVGGIIKRGHSSACETSSSDDASSFASHASEKSRGAGWYARRKAVRDLVKSESILLSKKQNTRVNGNKGDNGPDATVSPPYHASQSSCDSGVHHLNSGADLLDGEDLIYV